MARLNLSYAAATIHRLREERPGDYVALVHPAGEVPASAALSPACRATGANWLSHCGSVAGRSGCGSPTRKSVTWSRRANHWKSPSGASRTCSARVRH
jgi:hypothetical protein